MITPPPSRDDAQNEHELVYQVRELAESVLVANDKLEIVLAGIDRTLKTINNTLLEVAKEIRTHRG